MRQGKLLWTAGDDTIEYGSAILATLGGQRQVLAAGKDNVWGLDPTTGEVLWSYRHEGDERAMGGMTVVPVAAGEDRVFLMNKQDSSVMLRVKGKKKGYDVSELWSGNAIKASYVTPVYKDGYLYGMSNRIFTCLDAETGDIKWRSREPGDGFPTIVGDHIVMITKGGSLHVAEWWSEVAYADGHLFARSMAHLARIDPTSGRSAGGSSAEWLSRTEFGRFLDDLASAPDKNAAIASFLGRQGSFPIVEHDGTVHFVYRGDVEDVGIVGDMIGFRREDPMVRVEGTDFSHYSTRLEPDAAVTYGFIVDYGEPQADPLNSRASDGLFGEVSWFSMPAWQAPDFLEEISSSRQGRLETVEWTSQAREGQERSAEVYLPAGYSSVGDRRYPVAYVHHGKQALEAGQLKNALDNLLGASVEPLIAVFIHADEENPRGDRRGDEYGEMLVKELVPMIDERYRTIASPMGRASVGSGRAANVAVTQLREAGYRPAGGEVPEGYSWACWSGHTDELLEALFPLRQ